MKAGIKILILFALTLGLAFTVWAGDDEEGIPQIDPSMMAAMMQQVKQVKAIDWNQLAGCLPEELAGYKTGKLDGGTMNMDSPTNPGQTFSHSTVERPFTKESKDGETKEIKVTIMDSGLNQMIMAPFLMHMEYDSPDGSMKWTKVKDKKAALMIDKDEGKIEGVHLFTIVADRLIVMVEGDEKASVDEITEIANSIDYDCLDNLLKTADDTKEKE